MVAPKQGPAALHRLCRSYTRSKGPCSPSASLDPQGDALRRDLTAGCIAAGFRGEQVCAALSQFSRRLAAHASDEQFDGVAAAQEAPHNLLNVNRTAFGAEHWHAKVRTNVGDAHTLNLDELFHAGTSLRDSRGFGSKVPTLLRRVLAGVKLASEQVARGECKPHSQFAVGE